LVASLKEELHDSLADPAGSYLVVRQGSTAVGFVSVYERSGYVAIKMLAVLPEYQKLNYAKTMLALVQLRFPDRPYFGITRHAYASLRKFYAEYMNAVEDNYRVLFATEYPKLKLEDGWVTLNVGKISLRKSYLCVVLYGEELTGFPPVGIAKDISTIDKFFSRYSDVTFDTIAATSVTFENLLEYFVHVRTKQVEKVFVYYSGHGSNATDSKFPSIQLKGSFVSLERDLFAKLKAIFAMSVLGADCCNVVPSEPEDEGRPQLIARPGVAHPFSATGHLHFCSSSKGQPSMGSATLGGRFTRTFFPAFAGNWDDGLTATTKLLQYYPFVQVPVMERDAWDQEGARSPAPKSPNFSFVTHVR